MRIDIALDRACFIALVLETFNFGIFTILFAVTLQMITKKRISNANRLMLPTLCLIWIFSVAHWVIDIVRATEAFLDTPEGALAYYANIANPLQLAKTAVYTCLTLTGDFFLIYRCWVVFNRNWYVIALPILLWFGTGIAGFGVTHAFSLAGRGGIFVAGVVAPWALSAFCMTLSLNVICTLLIAYRILGARAALHRHNAQQSRVFSALIIFLESAALYSASLTVLLTLYVLNSNAQYILIDVTSSLIGITFATILLRLAMTNQASQIDSLASLRAQQNRSNAYPMTSVSVSRVVEVDSYGESKLAPLSGRLDESVAVVYIDCRL
ncbi:hypothetical protein DFH06DRAFT_154624 [Mycena polygramma]|nr:hypothetical protein DFH06DRAFT_154624 [Mycena polygramma]